MTNADFEEVLQRRLGQIMKVLSYKAVEYAQADDRLYNFKVAARLNNTTPVKAAWGMATKHLVSVMDLIDEKLYNTEDAVDEKIGDLINYLILIEALLTEQREIKTKHRDLTVMHTTTIKENNHDNQETNTRRIGSDL